MTGNTSRQVRHKGIRPYKAINLRPLKKKTPTQRLAELGLHDFETKAQCEKRLRQIRNVLADGKDGAAVAKQMENCSARGCDNKTCNDACWFAARKRRLYLLHGAWKLLRHHLGPFFLVTIIHPRWNAPLGDLKGKGTRGPQEWVKRRLNRMPDADKVVAVGQFERALNVELDKSKSWSGEIHLVVAGATKEDLRAAFSIEKRYRSDPQEKLLRVDQIDELVRTLGYATKYFLARRIAYIAKNGRQARRAMPLQSAHLAELAAWHASLKSGERMILFGCRRHGRKLVPLVQVCVRGEAA